MMNCISFDFDGVLDIEPENNTTLIALITALKSQYHIVCITSRRPSACDGRFWARLQQYGITTWYATESKVELIKELKIIAHFDDDLHEVYQINSQLSGVAILLNWNQLEVHGD